MNWKTWVPLVLAIVLGVVAAKVARDAIMKNKAAAVPVGKFTKVVITKADINPGQEIKAEDVTLSQVEADTAPASSFKDPTQVVGRVTESMMVKGQPIIEAMLAPTGAGSGLQALVPTGMRAITIEVNEFTGVAGMLTPGCRVDIVATINEGGNAGQIAKTIVQNVKVTAIGQRTANNGKPPQANEQVRSITLLAKLAEAEAIELACSTGRPRLVLRGGRDTEIASTDGITLGELRGNAGKNDPFTAVAIAPATQPIAPATQPIEQTARQEPPQRVVHVIKGGVESSVTLSLSDDGAKPTGTADTDPFRGAAD